ncbi:MAG: AAA-like domain-containing protein, partial [Trichodesmium sp.]
EQVCALASANELNMSKIEIEKLTSMVGGHPYLLQTAFDYLNMFSDSTVDEILATATTEAGIYKSHLRELWCSLLENPNLMAAMKMVADSIEPINLREDEAFKLESLGLVRRETNNVVARCNLYRLYFREHL